MKMLGIILMIVGALILGYQGFTYVTHEPVADVGPVHVEAEKQKTVWIPPVVGGVAVVAGLILALSGRRVD